MLDWTDNGAIDVPYVSLVNCVLVWRQSNVVGSNWHNGIRTGVNVKAVHTFSVKILDFVVVHRYTNCPIQRPLGLYLW